MFWYCCRVRPRRNARARVEVKEVFEDGLRTEPKRLLGKLDWNKLFEDDVVENQALTRT